MSKELFKGKKAEATMSSAGRVSASARKKTKAEDAIDLFHGLRLVIENGKANVQVYHRTDFTSCAELISEEEAKLRAKLDFIERWREAEAGEVKVA